MVGVVSVDAMLEAVAAACADLAGKRVCVALSGGVDSVVLLHMLNRLQAQIGIEKLSALHIHHGLSADADDWVAFCRRFCADSGVPFAYEKVVVRPDGSGIEAAARQARYAAFARLDVDALALAHHADDQVETFFLAALRGGGLRALAGMPCVRTMPSAGGRMVLKRPLLGFTRKEIEAYAAACGLPYVQDGSNSDTDLLRNWLRCGWLPQLDGRLPEYRKQIGAVVALLQDELAFLQEAANADWQAVHSRGRFMRDLWLGLSEVRRCALLADFARRHGLGVPSRRSVADFARVLAEADSAQWTLPKGCAQLYGGVLFAWKESFAEQWLWTRDGGCSGSLKELMRQTGVVWHEKADKPEIYCVRAAVGSDVLDLDYGRKPVFKLLQEYKVPPFMRALWPVWLDGSGRCLAVVNIRAARGEILPCHDGLREYCLKR